MPSSTRVSCAALNSPSTVLALMLEAHKPMVGSSGTSWPLLEYSTNNRPIGSSMRKLRNASPQAKWNKFGIEPRILPWVPLPEPGAPNRRMVRYLTGGLVAELLMVGSISAGATPPWDALEFRKYR